MFTLQKMTAVSSSPSARSTVTSILIVGAVIFILSAHHQPAEASIGYFENYGWPTYGIVKPFWMTPFSAFPSRSISGYSRKHSIYNGRGVLNFNGH